MSKQCSKSSVKFGGDSMMQDSKGYIIWQDGILTWRCTRNLCKTCGNSYKGLSSYEDPIFMQENAPSHSATRAKSFLEQEKSHQSYGLANSKPRLILYNNIILYRECLETLRRMDEGQESWNSWRFVDHFAR